jgi:hypothetical protein
MPARDTYRPEAVLRRLIARLLRRLSTGFPRGVVTRDQAHPGLPTYQAHRAP